MHMRPGSLFLTVALGVALMVSPSIIGGNGLMSYDQALAEKGGNGKGNSAASKGGAAASSNSQGKTASALGALNAGHAAPQAFANAAPNSRIGKIKAYYLASQAAAAADASVLEATFIGAAPQTVLTAYEALQADQTNVTLQNAFTQAVADAGLTPAYTAWQDAVAADAEATATLEAAANKTPLSDVTKDALDNLIAGSIY